MFDQVSGRGDLEAIANPSGAGGAAPIAIANSEFSERHGQVSPDSRWIAYDSDESGRPEIYVIPFPPGDGRTGKSLVSSNGGSEPRWRADGKELYFLDPNHSLMAVDVSTQPTFQAATPVRLFSAASFANDAFFFQYDVARELPHDLARRRRHSRPRHRSRQLEPLEPACPSSGPPELTQFARAPTTWKQPGAARERRVLKP